MRQMCFREPVWRARLQPPRILLLHRFQISAAPFSESDPTVRLKQFQVEAVVRLRGREEIRWIHQGFSG